MIIVKIVGGLGNQMFQYAYARVLEKKGYRVKLDISEFDTFTLHQYGLGFYEISLENASDKEIYKIKSNLFTRILNKINVKKTLISESSLVFDNNLLSPNDDRYISGYFQSEKYFLKIRDILLEEFVLKRSISSYATEMQKQIDFSKMTTISLHIRRGDYLTDTNRNIHGLCSIEYYEQSMALLNSQFNSVQYFIFSDDIAWVKENFKIKNSIYIDSEEERIPHEDIYLMSLCQHNITANSSFSWWGAWLNKNTDKRVIAPKKWFHDSTKDSSDLIPKEWIRL